MPLLIHYELDVLIESQRAPQPAPGSPHLVGIGLLVKSRSSGTRRIFQGHGFASDGDFPKLAAICYLFDSIGEDERAVVSVAGVIDRLKHFRASTTGLKKDGSQFVGHEYLSRILAAEKAGRLNVVSSSTCSVLDKSACKKVAASGLEEAEGMRSMLGDLYRLNRLDNTVVGFKEWKP